MRPPTLLLRRGGRPSAAGLDLWSAGTLTGSCRRREQDLPGSWGNPGGRMPCSLTPVGLLAPSRYSAGVLSPLCHYQDNPDDMCLSWLYRTAFGLAVYASQAPLRDRPTQDSLPAGGQPLPGRIHLPGSLREVSALSTDVYIASPFPRLKPGAQRQALSPCLVGAASRAGRPKLRPNLAEVGQTRPS